MAASEAVLTMQPEPWATKWRAAIWLARKMPRALTAKLKSHSCVGHLERLPHGRDAGVGDQDLAAAQCAERLAERALDRRAFAHVDLDGDGAAADLVRRPPGGLESISATAGATPHRAKRRGDGAADALRAASDERALAHDSE